MLLLSCPLVLSKETLTDYIEGKLEQLPEPSPPHQQSSLMSELYYLLADDYLKSGDNQYDSLHSNLFLRRCQCIFLCIPIVMLCGIICQTCVTALTGLTRGLDWLWLGLA